MIFYQCKHLKQLLLQTLVLSPRFLKGLAAGRVAEWAKLYDHYAGALYGIILQQVSAEVAPKVLEKCWLTFYRLIGEYCPSKERLFTWMYRLTMQTCRETILPPEELEPVSYLSIVPLGVRAN
jgi:hypothetical protein